MHHAVHVGLHTSAGQLFDQSHMRALKLLLTAVQYGDQIHHGVVACQHGLQDTGLVHVSVDDCDVGQVRQALASGMAARWHRGFDARACEHLTQCLTNKSRTT